MNATTVITFADTDGVRHTIERTTRVRKDTDALKVSQAALAWFRTRVRFKLDGVFYTVDHRKLVHVHPKQEEVTNQQQGL